MVEKLSLSSNKFIGNKVTTSIEKILLRDSTKFKWDVVSIGLEKNLQGTAIRHKEILLYNANILQKPFILLIEEAEMHELDINPDLFYMADAILIKKGNVASYMSCIAREVSIPALVNIPIEKIPKDAKLNIKIDEEEGYVEVISV
jgi:hypothetical protein